MPPPTIYSFDSATGISTGVGKPEINYPMELYVTRRTFCESNDGAPLPVYVTHLT